jgi:signal transduction histidine kinase
MDGGLRSWGWTRRVSPSVVDWAIAGGLLLVGLAGLFGRRAEQSRTLLPVAVASLVVVAIALGSRRRYPTAVLAAVVATQLADLLLGVDAAPVGGLALLVAAYSVSAHASGRWRAWAGQAAAVMFAIAAVAIILGGNLLRLAPAAALAVVFSGAWLLGDYLRSRRQQVADLEARAARLEREQEMARSQARDEERARIARELHDVVAHDVTMMVVQAGAARTVQATQPQAAAEALSLVEQTGRQTLVELNHLLGVLRSSPGEALARSPQPRVEEASVLADQLRHAGLDVELNVEGQPVPLPPALDLTAYRILQEATTNVLKHARATTVHILVRYLADALELSVRDNGRPVTGETVGSGPGHGLIGMRERAALFGGDLQAGPGANGGFAVMAHLPLGAI